MSGVDPDRHYVANDDYDEAADIQALDRADLDAPTWLLIWRRFLRHKLGVVSGVYLLVIYLALPFVDSIAPYHYAERHENHIYAPPQPIRFWSEEQGLIGLHTYATEESFDRETFQMKSVINWDEPQMIPLFSNCGDTYRFLGLFETNRRLICPPEGGTLFIFGSDRLGRDVHSRIMHGAQLSLTVGLIGVAVSFSIGLVLGGMAGYFGGIIDSLTMRAIEIIRSLPELPIWLALSAAIPATWGPVSVFFVISIILGLLDWPGLARAVRSKFLSLREEDYVKAAELMGARPTRIIAVHMMPNFMSHLVASATLSIPAMILGETALSFLGLGLRAPAVSWGLMLNDALDLTVVEIYPWLLMPLVPVIMVVLAFSFLGDGLRDALDPYS